MLEPDWPSNRNKYPLEQPQVHDAKQCQCKMAIADAMPACMPLIAMSTPLVAELAR